jgi:hypothetical protein
VTPSPSGFQIEVEFMLMQESPVWAVLTFESAWGSDWRLACREAITEYALDVLGEEVDGVVMPDLTTV